MHKLRFTLCRLAFSSITELGLSLHYFYLFVDPAASLKLRYCLPVFRSGNGTTEEDARSNRVRQLFGLHHRAPKCQHALS